MSDRLAVSVSLSVLMMSIFVLFGSQAARLPLGPGEPATHHGAAATGLPGNPVQLLISSQ